MILLLDIGNTRIKPALWDGASIRPQEPVAHEGDPERAAKRLPAASPEAIWVANVTGAEHELRIEGALQRRFGVAPRFAHTRASAAGLRVAYAEPERLGVDRWLMMLALWRERRTAFCVAAAGTALTFDSVDDHGVHKGGFIAAGLATHQQAVLGATRFATRTVEAPYEEGLGDDTEGCVRQGALFACAGALDRAGGELAPERRILSGGDAELLLPHLAGAWTPRPHLVLEGLLACAQGRDLN